MALTALLFYNEPMRSAIPFIRNSTIIFNYRYTDTVIIVVYSIGSACEERQIAIYRSFSILGVRFTPFRVSPSP